MTYLQLVNEILTRLRESSVTAVSATTYSKLVGTMVNEAKREVEDAWDWLHLRSTIQVTTASGTFKYTLTGAGDRYRILRDRINHKPDVYNDTQDYQLNYAPSSAWMTRQKLGNSPQSGDPLYFDINGQAGGDPQVDLDPTPGGIQVIHFNMVIPQTNLSVDATELTVPNYPVILSAHAKAMRERGEDGGQALGNAELKAYNAVQDAISFERDHMPISDYAELI